MYLTIPEQKMITTVLCDLADVYFDYNPADLTVGARAWVTINRVMRGKKDIRCVLNGKELKELEAEAMEWFCENFDGDNDPEYDD